MNDEITCLRCRHWDLEHVQQSELDQDGVPIQDYFARCMNPKPLWEGRFVEAADGCGAFKRR